jgi:hypothetical protein
MKRYLKDIFYGVLIYIAVAILAVIIYGFLFLNDMTESATMNQVYVACAVLSLLVSFAFTLKSKPRSKSEAGVMGAIWMATSVILLIITIAPGLTIFGELLGVFGFWIFMFGILLGPLVYAAVKHLK